MKHLFKSIISFVVLVLYLCILPQSAKSQPNPNEDPDTPIDGGVSLLVAAGVAYGIKKIRDERKKKQINYPD